MQEPCRNTHSVAVTVLAADKFEVTLLWADACIMPRAQTDEWAQEAAEELGWIKQMGGLLRKMVR